MKSSNRSNILIWFVWIMITATVSCQDKKKIQDTPFSGKPAEIIVPTAVVTETIDTSQVNYLTVRFLKNENLTLQFEKYPPVIVTPPRAENLRLAWQQLIDSYRLNNDSLAIIIEAGKETPFPWTDTVMTTFSELGRDRFKLLTAIKD